MACIVWQLWNRQWQLSSTSILKLVWHPESRDTQLWNICSDWESDNDKDVCCKCPHLSNERSSSKCWLLGMGWSQPSIKNSFVERYWQWNFISLSQSKIKKSLIEQYWWKVWVNLKCLSRPKIKNNLSSCPSIHQPPLCPQSLTFSYLFLILSDLF